MCTIKRDECFAIKAPNGGAPRASDIFKHVAFDRTECGDCSECPYPLPLGTGRPLRCAGREWPDRTAVANDVVGAVINALVRASGPLGLSAFLPDPERRSPATGGPLDIDAVPHLPLVDDWHNGEFALRSAMHLAPGTSVREWSMRLMQRYRYVIGESPSTLLAPVVKSWTACCARPTPTRRALFSPRVPPRADVRRSLRRRDALGIRAAPVVRPDAEHAREAGQEQGARAAVRQRRGEPRPRPHHHIFPEMAGPTLGSACGLGG